MSSTASGEGNAAFISYSHRYGDWVRVLHENLEKSLNHAGYPGRVFCDQVDLGPGHSWVSELQAGLEKSRHLVLVATPDALASVRVADEWQGFVTCPCADHLGTGDNTTRTQAVRG